MTQHSSFVPIRAVNGTASGQWFRTRPDLFKEVFSPPRFVFFLLLATLGVTLCFLAFKDPAATAEYMQRDRRRDWISIIMAFISPPVITLVGIYGMLRWAKRWSAIGYGILGSSLSKKVAVSVDPAQVMSTLKSHAGNPQAFVRAYREIPTSPPSHSYIVTLQTKKGDALTLVAARNLSASEAHKDGEFLIEVEPALFVGEQAFDAFDYLSPASKKAVT